MNLGQFHTRVSGAIKRGTSLDAIIPLWVAEAARVLEQNYTFSWMERNTEVTFPAGNIQLVWTADAFIKSVNWIKPIRAYDASAPAFKWLDPPLVGVSQDQILGINGGNPAGYYLLGTDGAYTVNFDSIPQSEWKALINWNKYTDWPVADASTPALLVRGQLALFAQTLILFANEQRDPRMAETYGGILQGALNTLLRSEEELKLQHQNDLKMQYSGLS